MSAKPFPSKLIPAGGTVGHAPEQARMAGGFLIEFQKRNPMDARIEAEDGRAFDMAVADAFPIVRNLAGIVSGIVRVRPAGTTAFVVHFRFPLHIGCRIE